MQANGYTGNKGVSEQSRLHCCFYVTDPLGPDDYCYSRANTNHLDRSIAQLKNAKKHELMEIPEDE